MSREDVDLVMRGLGAALRRPRPDFGTVNALFHPDHVFIPLAARKLGEAERKGARSYQAWLREQAGFMPGETKLESAVDIAPDTVLAVMTSRFHGVSSGADVEQRLWAVVSVGDDKITRTEVYNDPREALEAVRLRS